MKLLIATGNPGKLREYHRLLADIYFDIVGLDDVDLNDMDVEETGDTFEANAILKAKAYANASNELTLADDSGLEVDALDGRPGVHSARYGEPHYDDADRRVHLLDEMDGIPWEERTARFVCVIAIYDPHTGETRTTRGTCEGHILEQERDAGKGFGYDAIFQPDGFDKSFAEISQAEKNHISHRGHAAKLLPPILAEFQDTYSSDD